MSELLQPLNPDHLRRTGRENAIGAMGVRGFGIELGPNDSTFEVVRVTPETAPETGIEPSVPLTDDEAAYVAGTLGPAIVGTTVERIVQ